MHAHAQGRTRIPRRCVHRAARRARTFEEIFEIIVGRQLNTHAKPVVLLNTNRYWEPLRAMVQQGIEQHFIKPDAQNYFHLAASVPEVIQYIRDFVPTPPDDKWLAMQTARI